MTTKTKLLISLFTFFTVSFCTAQSFSGVYKVDPFFKRISSTDTIYVVNFWATWCKPCVEELPIFDSLNLEVKGQAIKVLLVNLDFVEKQRKVKDFLRT
jgi:thiol-disulfide isomerase/thioredoxin